jgi:hypothetical protein
LKKDGWIQPASPDPDREWLVGSIAKYSAEFASYSQILSTLKAPVNKKSISSARLLKEIGAESKDDVEMMKRINEEIYRRRVAALESEDGDREQAKTALVQLLKDLRLVLTDEAPSPKIESLTGAPTPEPDPLKAILGDKESAARIRRYIVGRKA